MTREMKIPGPNHPISVEPSSDRVIVRAGGATIADSTSTLVPQEPDYPPVRHIPLDDVDQTLLAPSETATFCPYKGEASYRSITTEPDRGRNAVWFYDEPYAAVEAIRGHVAFYPDRAEITIEAA